LLYKKLLNIAEILLKHTGNMFTIKLYESFGSCFYEIAIEETWRCTQNTLKALGSVWGCKVLLKWFRFSISIFKHHISQVNMMA